MAPVRIDRLTSLSLRFLFAAPMRLFVSRIFFAMMTVIPLSDAEAATFLGCESVLLSGSDSARDMTPDQRDALRQADLLFSRLSSDDIEAALHGLSPGQWRDLSDRFAGEDARWRFWRPMALPNDPDALTLPPAQRQIMVRPRPDDQAVALLVAGLAGSSAQIAQPMVVGLRRGGDVFIIDPKTPERCHWPLTDIADAVETALRYPL